MGAQTCGNTAKWNPGSVLQGIKVEGWAASGGVRKEFGKSLCWENTDVCPVKPQLGLCYHQMKGHSLESYIQTC